MKKFGIIALAALLVVAFTVPASALENVFGGYWRTRMYTQNDFNGQDNTVALTGQDFQAVDTRTRLYYTAILNENVKLVNKFEIDTVWGRKGVVGGIAGTSVGDLGADEIAFEVKNTYADFNLGPINAKVGIQGLVLSRGFLMDEDFSGMVVSYNGEGFSIPFVWAKFYEGTYGEDAGDLDYDMYALSPTFTLGEGITINPVLAWATSDSLNGFDATFAAGDQIDWYIYGLNADAKFGPVKVWFTGMMQDGSIDYAAVGVADDDISAYLIDIGAAYDMGMFDIHAEYFYASGDDNPADTDLEAFGFAPTQSHYWAEIMGLGIFDNQASANSCADDITNIWAVNLGSKIKPMDKLTVAVDLWYAELAEPRALNIDETLGTELDVVVTYQLVDGLNLDMVGAYLWADEGTYKDQEIAGISDSNPWELGARLSLSF